MSFDDCLHGMLLNIRVTTAATRPDLDATLLQDALSAVIPICNNLEVRQKLEAYNNVWCVVLVSLVGIRVDYFGDPQLEQQER